QKNHLIQNKEHKQRNKEEKLIRSPLLRHRNPIDDCWRCDPNWSTRRHRLADCAIGFGKNAVGGKYGRIYTVTDPSHDDPVNPKPGTLRHAAIQPDPLWIIFKSDMVIRPKQELIINSHKTIDGRGASVHIAGGACIAIHHASNIIVHGIHTHDYVKSGNAVIRDSPSRAGWWEVSDGDGVAIFGGRNFGLTTARFRTVTAGSRRRISWREWKRGSG
ncbi:probable pectate lyase 22, partial [Phtheirospermum japonicum]